MLDLIRHGEADEFCSYFPQWKKLRDELEVKLQLFLEEANSFYKSIRHLDKGDFARLATVKVYSKLLIRVHIKKTSPSIEDYLCTCLIEELCTMLNIVDHEKTMKTEQHVLEL